MNAKRDYWAEMVEKKWRAKFDHDGPSTPSTQEMARMMDQYGWSK